MGSRNSNSHSNSKWTFIALNLYKTQTLMRNEQNAGMSRDVARVMHHERQWNILSKTMEGMPCCRGMF